MTYSGVFIAAGPGPSTARTENLLSLADDTAATPFSHLSRSDNGSITPPLPPVTDTNGPIRHTKTANSRETI